MYIELLLRTLGADPGRVVAIDADTGRHTSAAELAALIGRIAYALREAGVTNGSLVALAAPITVEAIAARYAASMLGAATVYCANAADPERFVPLLTALQPDTVIVFPETAAAAQTARNALSVGPVPGVDVDLLTTGPGTVTEIAHVDPSATCVFVSSGGTTGIAKASGRDWARYTALVDQGSMHGRRELICIPLAYIAQSVVDTVLIGGGMVVLRRGFEPNQVAHTLQDHQITHVTLVEPLLVELVECEALAKSNLSTLEAITHIGADAAASLRARWLSRIGKPVLVQPYGASESGIISTLGPPEYSLDHPELLGTSGRPLPTIELRIIGSDGKDCGVGELGTIVVRSPEQAQGYRIAPPTSGFVDDGWFDTHDIGLVDGAGYLTVKGRASDMRIINGRSVFPVDIQNAFCALEHVRYAVAVAAPNEGDGFGVALVTDTSVSHSELMESVRSSAGAHLVPHTAMIVESMPRTEQGKPDREALSNLLWPSTDLSHLPPRSSGRCQ